MLGVSRTNYPNMIVIVITITVLLQTTTVVVNGLFSSGGGGSGGGGSAHTFPHSHTYKAHAWDEYNLGPLENIEVQLSGGTGQAGEPSHILLCRALLQQEQQVAQQQAQPQETQPSNSNSIIVVDEEDDAICRNSRNPFKSLLTMFASSLITHVSHILQSKRAHSANIFYEHSCGINLALEKPNAHDTWITDATIQQLLPPFLKMGFSQIQEEVLVPKILQKCQMCVSDYEMVKQQHGSIDALEQKRFPSCILSSSLEETGTGVLGQQEESFVAYKDPILRHRQKQRNLRSFGSNSRVLQEQFDSDLVHDMRNIDIDILKGLIPSLKNNLRQAAEEWTSLRHLQVMSKDTRVTGGGGDVSSIVRGSKGYSEQRSKGTLIYLDCALGDCISDKDKALAMPFWVYASELPRNVHAIEIIVSHSCASDIGGCGTHALKLKEFLTNYIPNAQAVTLEQPSANTGELYSRMLLAGHLLGPPSLSMVIPMLSTSYKSTFISHQTLYPWMDTLLKLQQSNQLTYGQSLEGIQSYASSEVEVPFIKSPFHLQALEEFLIMPMTDLTLKSTKCSKIRGRMGQWVLGTSEQIYQNQYKGGPILGYAGNADTAWYPMYSELEDSSVAAKRGSIEGPHRNATKYIWRDYFDSSCSVERMTHDNLCQTLLDLNIQRVMFLGDSLQFHWSQGFWKLLGQKETPGSDTSLQWDLQLECPSTSTTESPQVVPIPPRPLSDPGQLLQEESSTSSKTIQFAFIRNDHLNSIEEEIPYGVPNCGNFSYCTAWQEYYQNSPQNTLLIANTGPHQYHPDEYLSDLKGFFNFITSSSSKNSNRQDIIFMRNTVPGHPGCQTLFEPFNNFDQVNENADYSQEPYKYFNWHLFKNYNTYLEEMIQSITKQGGEATTAANNNATAGEATAALWNSMNGQTTQTTSPIIELLDVYEMTALRADGHISSQENHVMEFLQSPKCPDCKIPQRVWNNDCLHYSLPGPIDWWSHLLYSNLRDLAQFKEMKQ